MNVSEQDLALASQAFEEFEKKNYDSCISSLTKLAYHKLQDKNVQHNLAVVEYYKSGLTKTTEFHTSLSEINKKIQTEMSNSSVDFVEHSTLYYNLAVVSYSMKQFSNVLESFKRIELSGDNIDDVLLNKIIYLLIDTNLAVHMPHKALELIKYLEKVMNDSKGNYEESDKKNNKSNKDDKQNVLLNQHYRLKCYLMMRSLTDVYREIKQLADSSKEALFLKAQYEMLMKKYSQSIKTLSFHQGSDIKSRISTMFCANNIAVNYFEMKKYNLAHRYLSKAIEHKNNLSEISKKNGSSLESLMSNKEYELLYNMGVTLLHCNKPSLAFDCLLGVVQVYQFNPRLWLRLAECSVMTHKQNNRDDCSYDKKMSVIHKFIGSSENKKAILGTGVNNKNIINSKDSSAMPMPTMAFASLCLENALLCLRNMKHSSAERPTKGHKTILKKNKKNNNNVVADEVDSDVEKSTDDDHEAGVVSSDELFIAVSPSNPVKQNEVNNLRCSILTLKAYIALYHKNYLMALKDTETLLQQPSLSGMHRYLGLMYKAEALVGLDRLPESIDLLIGDIEDINIFHGDNIKYIQKKDEEDANKSELNSEKLQNNSWFPGSVDEARSLMNYNMAVVHVINGDFTKARSFLQKSLQHLRQPYPVQVYYLKIYLEVVEGKNRMGNTFNITNVLN